MKVLLDTNVLLRLAGSLRAGIRNANLRTLVFSVHRHDLDVQVYLRDIIEHWNRGTAKPSELLPDVWKVSYPEAIRTYREVERRDKAELAVVRNAKRKMLHRMLGGAYSPIATGLNQVRSV